ncbi:YbfB/YjiJ family MFS transporter [Rheinheimera sp.]|uniref:YbfB/YjiJ family MFS transporter n=1 Tax=Rheinheimera sp. TaxID=1869214 RepID=UPI003AF8B690
MGIRAGVQILLAGFCSQLLCLGIARFAYTPLIPLMQPAGLNEWLAGLLAALNYVGYFAGALLAVRLSQWQWKFYAYRCGLVLAVVTTLAMGLSDNPLIWGLSRFFAGLSAAASMLLASGLILHQLKQHGRPAELGLHFAGLGLGIALVAVAVELCSQLGLSWQAQWNSLAALSLLLVIPAWCWLPAPKHASSQAIATQKPVIDPLLLRGLYLMYFCAGYGYVVTVTFIVSMAKQDAALSGGANWAFAVLGLAAAPATLVWDRIARRQGYLPSLRLALAINTFAIVLPALWAAPWSLMLSALLFGGSFIGCVSLMLTLAGRLYPDKPAQLMGKMTLCYGTAQVVAPAFSGWLAAASGDFHSSLIVAGGIAALGVLILSWLVRRTAIDHLAMRRE